MTETESQRSQLIGVNPHSQTLKFLNNKNNIAALSLRKQLASFERQRSMNMSSMEARRLDTELFLKQVKYLEGQDDNNDMYVYVIQPADVCSFYKALTSNYIV